MARHEKLLKQWVANQLITESQAEAIRKFESGKPSSMLFGVIALGVGIIGLGCISIIAANWKTIPDVIKLALDFAILFATAWFAVKESKANRPLRYEGLLIFLMVFTLASIGLVSQVFHTKGELYQAFLFWSVITSGIMLASRKLVVPLFWATGFFASVVAFLIDSEWGRTMLGSERFHIVAALPFLAAIFAILGRAFLGEGPQTKAFRIWVILFAISGMLIGEAGWRLDRATNLHLQIQFGLTLITVMAIGLSQEYRKSQKIILWLLIIFYLMPFQFPSLLGPIEPYALRGMIYASTTILTLGTFAFFCATIERKKLVQWCLNLIGLRFLVLYFQALGGLASTGAGLILSGGVIIGMVVLWKKKRKVIEDFVEGLVK